MLLVQLTSDMYDAADLKHELAISAGRQFNGKVGKLKGGEVVSNTGRRRRSKNDKNNRSNNDNDDDDDDYNGHNNQNEIFTLSNNLLLPQQIGGVNNDTKLSNEAKTPLLSSMKITPKVLQVQNMQRVRVEENTKSANQMLPHKLDPFSAKNQRKRNLAGSTKSRKSSVHSNRSKDTGSGARTPKNENK